MMGKKALFLLFILLSILHATSQSWERFFGSQNIPESFQNFCESYDHGYYILGIRYFYPDTKSFVIKSDINGFPIYELSLGINNNQLSILDFISPTNDGGVILCGELDSLSYFGDVGVIKLNQCGDLEWCRIWQSDEISDWGKEIHQLEDGGYIMRLIGMRVILHMYGYTGWTQMVIFFGVSHMLIIVHIL